MNRLRKITGIVAFGAAMLISAQSEAGVLASNTATSDSPEMGLITKTPDGSLLTVTELIHKFTQNTDVFNPILPSTNYSPGYGTGAMTSQVSGCVLLDATNNPRPESGFNQRGVAAPGGSVANLCDVDPLTLGIQTSDFVNFADSPQTPGAEARTQAGAISVNLPHAITVGAPNTLGGPTGNAYNYLKIDGSTGYVAGSDVTSLNTGNGIAFRIETNGDISVMKNKFVQDMDIFTTSMDAGAWTNRIAAGEQQMSYSTVVSGTAVPADTLRVPANTSRTSSIVVDIVQNLESNWDTTTAPDGNMATPYNNTTNLPVYTGQDLFSTSLTANGGSATGIAALPQNPPGWQN